ncbi:MAG: metallophosphoesterase [Chthoniobacterales bacterium]|nr:metallophosphoesterase [Chthoniobacterales bacterium]
MKILLTADLHSQRHFYDWVVLNASRYDLVAVAGDLLDIFARDQGGQIDFLRSTWFPAMTATGVPLAISSGNHDGSAIVWLSHIDRPGSVVGDGSTQLITARSGERLIVTTCPYYRSFRQDDPVMIDLWEKGAALRDSEKAPWLVLHHEPPAGLIPPGTITMHWLNLRLREYGADFVSCGHFHEGGEPIFAQKVENAWCFNAGQQIYAPVPNHIILNTAERTATRVDITSTPDLLLVEEQTEINLD